MKPSLRRMLCQAALAGVASVSVLAAAEVSTIGDFRFLSGQHFAGGTAGDLSGNASLSITPAISLHERFSLIPTYAAGYRGTKEAGDLAGGDTLFQDAQHHFVSVKGIYAALPSLRLKAGASYRLEFLRETRDERWGGGLFDYRKLNAGFEAEYSRGKKHSVRAGVDHYLLSFPNFKSLESQQDEALSRELVGERVLDSRNTMITLAGTTAFGSLRTELGIFLTGKSFPEQPLALADGSLSSEKRADTQSSIQAGVQYPFRLGKALALVASCDFRQSAQDSTQAHYDPKKPRFIADYYDYTSRALAPTLHFMIGAKPWVLSLGGSAGRQDYGRRPVQDETGNYIDGETVSVDETSLSLGITYPIARHFKLRLTANYLRSQSNMRYETAYSYNYETSNYLTGFSYEF